MHLMIGSGEYTVVAWEYSLTFKADRPFAILHNAAGEQLAELFALSSVHPLEGRDDTLDVGEWEVEERGGEISLTIQATSTVWVQKRYRFRCYPRRFTYEIEVEGEGALADVHYFGGYFSGRPRWGSGFFVSGQSWSEGFNPEPDTEEAHFFSPAEGAVIDIMGVPLPGRANWFFTPPPFCFAFGHKRGWTSVGIEAAAGENNFSEYRYQGRRGSFYLTLDYEGHTQVAGHYRLPLIGFDFRPDPYAALEAHVEALRTGGCVPVSSQPVVHPLWWRMPIFSGWGAQCHLAAVLRGKAPDFARQDLYERFLAQLEQHGIEPGIVVIDDKWQLTYGENRVDREKWPDLQGFVARQHARGRRVLLWLKLWDPEGLPDIECITNGGGIRLAVDPTHPDFAQRLRETVRALLSPEGYDADGFKIDFSARIPSGPGIRHYGDAWGLELLQTYLGIIYQAAKAAKPEALIMTHTPHPYLANVVDMIRLNDINGKKNVLEAMRHRARIAAIACPDALIDTDNWPIPNIATWRSYVALQSQLGVPSLYYTTHVDGSGEALQPQDYALLRTSWEQYRAQFEKVAT